MLEQYNRLTKLKIFELKTMGEYASSYCYNHPSIINVDVTGKCNLSCVMCSRKFADIPNIDIDEELVYNLLNWMKQPVTVNFAGFGEPLLYPIDTLISFINIASEKSKKVQVITNGTLLDKIKRDKLGSSNLTSLIVSVDSADKNKYYNIRGTSLFNVKYNIVEFIKEFDIPVYINAIKFNDDVSDWDMFKEETGVKGIRFKPLKSFDENVTFVKKNCFQPFYEFNLGVDGRFHPCCTCRVYSTSFKKYDFDKVWNGKFIRAFRKMLIKKKYPKYCKSWCNL